MERFREGVERMASLHFAESQLRDSAKWKDRERQNQRVGDVCATLALQMAHKDLPDEESGFHRSRYFSQLRLLQLRKITRSQPAKSTETPVLDTE
jgi:hypothetical protein